MKRVTISLIPWPNFGNRTIAQIIFEAKKLNKLVVFSVINVSCSLSEQIAHKYILIASKNDLWRRQKKCKSIKSKLYETRCLTCQSIGRIESWMLFASFRFIPFCTDVCMHVCVCSFGIQMQTQRKSKYCMLWSFGYFCHLTFFPLSFSM